MRKLLCAKPRWKLSSRKLEIDLEERRAEISQQQDIEVLMAAQIAEVARQKADSERETAQARIQMELVIQTAEIEREQALEITEQERNILAAEKFQDEVLEVILYRGQLPRSDVPAWLDTGERNARRTVSALIDRGVVTSESTRAPLKLAFPATLASRWMPGLFPDKPS